MKKSDHQVKKLYKKCLKWIEDSPKKRFNFRKSWKFQGMCDWDKIWVDPRQEMGRTIFHEIIHFIYPDYTEAQVMYLESRIMNTCSHLELSHVFSKFFKKLHKNEAKKSKKK